MCEFDKMCFFVPSVCLSVQVSYMISAWARMCKIIGPGFVQYLPVVMGPLIQAASLKPEIAFVDCELNRSKFNDIK